jgi:hypothetical protein
MDQQILWVVAALTAGTLIGTFWRMQGGFGPMNLRAVGIVLIAALASVLAIGNSENLTAAMGILGAIAGYLFGAKSTKSEEASASVGSAVSATGAKFGDNAKVAGRDINETVHNIERMLGDVQSMANTTVKNLEVSIEEARHRPLFRRKQESISWQPNDPVMQRTLVQLRSSHPNSWTQEWIDMCLESPEFLDELGKLIESHSLLGWRASDISFDNTAAGLYAGVTFEREVKIPGV